MRILIITTMLTVLLSFGLITSESFAHEEIDKSLYLEQVMIFVNDKKNIDFLHDDPMNLNDPIISKNSISYNFSYDTAASNISESHTLQLLNQYGQMWGIIDMTSTPIQETFDVENTQETILYDNYSEFENVALVEIKLLLPESDMVFNNPSLLDTNLVTEYYYTEIDDTLPVVLFDATENINLLDFVDNPIENGPFDVDAAIPLYIIDNQDNRYYEAITIPHKGEYHPNPQSARDSTFVNWILNCDELQSTVTLSDYTTSGQIITQGNDLFCYDAIGYHVEISSPKIKDLDENSSRDSLDEIMNTGNIITSEFPLVDGFLSHDVVLLKYDGQKIYGIIHNIHEITYELPSNTNVIPYDFKGGEILTVYELKVNSGAETMIVHIVR